MKSIQEMNIGEFGAFVSDHLREQGIDVVLSGGSCVTIYSRNRYQSFDLDFDDTGGGGDTPHFFCLGIGSAELNQLFTI